MAARKPIKWALVGMAGAATAGVVAFRPAPHPRPCSSCKTQSSGYLLGEAATRRTRSTRDRALRNPDWQKIVDGSRLGMRRGLAGFDCTAMPDPLRTACWLMAPRRFKDVRAG